MKLTRKQLAGKLEMTTKRLGKVERGEADLKIVEFLALCLLLGGRNPKIERK